MEKAPVENAMPEQPAEKKKFSPVIKVPLNEMQEKAIIDLITSEHSKILAEYEQYNYGQGWFNHIDDTNKIIESAKDVFDSGENVRELGIAQIAADVVASKDKRQTMGVTPVITLEQEEEIENIGDLRNREDRLDYILRKDCKIEDLNYTSAPRSCINGVAIIKVPYDKKIEYRTRKAHYRPDAEGKAKFEKTYGGSEILKADSKARKNWDKLNAGQEVEIIDVEPVVVFNGVKLYRVDPKKFFARINKKDFQTHKVISELIDEVSIADIEACVSDDAYGYDQAAVDRLKEKIGTNEKTRSDWRGNKYESVVLIKLESEVKEGESKKNDHVQRYLVTYEDTFKIVLRCIHYPYEHGKVCYVPICAIPRDDSWTGWSFAVRDADMESIGNGLLNSLMNEFKLAENGVVLTDDNKTDFNRVSVANGDGMSVLKFSPGAKFQQVAWTFPHVDRVGLINWATNHAALKTGIDPAIQSGSETPSDPSAPYAKSALKQANSNMRIEDIILNLQKGYEAYAEQVESIYAQFVDVDAENGTIGYYRGETKKEVNTGIYGKKVRYVCQGSRISFDKNADSSATIGFAGALSKLSPETMQDVDVIYYLASILVNNTGGSVERGKDIILKPLKDQAEAKKALLEYNQKRKEAFWQYGQQQGKNEQEIQQAWEQIQAQEKQAKQPQAGQGVPPAGNPPEMSAQGVPGGMPQ